MFPSRINLGDETKPRRYFFKSLSEVLPPGSCVVCVVRVTCVLFLIYGI